MTAWLGGLPGPTPWVASVSPERFLSIAIEDDGRRVVEICPIKGTRPRGAAESDDVALAAALLGDEKERAEHVMVVDLERNDLGVVCEPGSIVVDPLYRVVPTRYCHQLVSSVRGMLRQESTIADLLEATFPCGSVTGAPKLAAIRIAEELESGPRGAYCGSLLVAMPGALDSSVLIRTLEGERGEGESGAPGSGSGACARWGAGAGITHDSDPAAEWLETLLKASPVTGDGAPKVALRETMRVQAGVVPLLDYHLARLAQGGGGPSVLARVRAAVAEELARAFAVPAEAPLRGRLGITVTPDGGVAAGFSSEPSTLQVEGGPRLALVEVAEAPELPPNAAKPAARAYWDRAHRRAGSLGADQAALVEPDGTLIDGSTATIWLVSEGRLITPPAPPAVAGVAREVLFDLAGKLQLPIKERRVSTAEFESADEVFLSNAYGGVVAARDRGGPVSERVQLAFEAELASRVGG